MDELGQAERAKLVERFGRRFSAGETIYSEGDEGRACFLIQEGKVRLVKRVRAAERSLTVLHTGDIFGEDALLPRASRSATAVALNDVSALELDTQTFGVLISSNAEVASRLVTQLVQRLRDAEAQFENSILRDHPSRVVNTLLRVAQTEERGPDGHVIHLSPMELSSRAGIDVDSVKRTVQQLRDGGYLKILDEAIVLPDLSPLQRLYELLGMKEDVRSGLP